MPEPVRLTHPSGRPLRVAHLTTVDMSLALLLETELRVDVEAGFETYGISAPGTYVPRVEALGVRHVPVHSLTRAWSVGQDLRAARELRSVLRRIKPDVLHTHNPKTGVLGRLLGRLSGVPVIVNTCHGLWLRPEDRWARRTFVLGAEIVSAQASHAELYQNSADQDRLVRWVWRKPSEVVGNGIDLARFRRDDVARRRVRDALGIADDDILVGCVGRRVAEKGISEFVEAARLLSDRATFVWAGPDDPDKLDAVPERDPAVLWLGEWQEMPALYSALDVFVLASYREGFSRSAMEAAACGLPMVLTDIRGCREIGTHGEELLLVPAGNSQGLAAAIGQLLDDPVERRRMGKRAADHAHETFDQVAIARRSIDTYREVARRRSLHWG